MAPSCKLELTRFPPLLKIQDGAECGNILMGGDKLTQNVHCLRLTLQYSNGWGQTIKVRVDYIEQEKSIRLSG